MNVKVRNVQAVLFDMDGTITRPNIDFVAIRIDIGVPIGESILEHVAGLEGAERDRAQKILAGYEADAARNSELNDGAEELVGFLHERDICTALITRNNRNAAQVVCDKHGLRFDVVVAAEDAPPKPSPEPVRLVARRLQIEPARMLMVGDFLFDIQAGTAAETRTVFLTNGRKPDFEVEADFTIDGLAELIDMLSL